MIREHAVLPARPGDEAAFETAFETAFEAAVPAALPLISGSPGFRRLSVSRGIESPSHYRLHHFDDPFPAVRPFTDVVTA
jgi:hypothetical protein